MGPLEKSLRAAKDRIVKYGWMKYRGGGVESGFCAAAAIRYPSPENIDTFLESHLFKMANNISPKEEICNWNDKESMTKEGVLGGFDKAIALAVAKGV